MPPGSSATLRRRGILGVTTVDLPRERLESLLGARDAKNWLASFRMRLGFVDPLMSSTVSALADEARLSRYHFSRVFRAATGLPPHRHLTERRLERAKVPLRATEMPIIEIALDVGFSGQAHLTDCFHRVIGGKPGEFRRRR